jgi:excisionase family DNA binding protein
MTPTQDASSISSIAGRVTITVPEAGDLLGVGRTAAYDAVARGELPALRIGRRILVPVAPLLAMLGVDSQMTAPARG